MRSIQQNVDLEDLPHLLSHLRYLETPKIPDELLRYTSLRRGQVEKYKVFIPRLLPYDSPPTPSDDTQSDSDESTDSVYWEHEPDYDSD